MLAEVTYKGILDMQVCVPKDWSDKDVKIFAEKENPCGTQQSWCIRRQGDKALAGQNERSQCSKYEDNCHIMLDC